MNTILQRGFSPLYIAVIVAVLAVGGYVLFRSDTPNDAMMPSPSAVMEKKDDAMMPKESGAMMPKESGAMMMKFSGAVLAGSASPLLDFTKADYDVAVASGKLVTLFFYANWCPLCKAEFPKMQEVFNGLTEDDVVGFRVNYNDNETDADEKALAKEFGVAYQHTKVFVKNGTRVVKTPETWTADMYISEINKHK